MGKYLGAAIDKSMSSESMVINVIKIANTRLKFSIEKSWQNKVHYSIQNYVFYQEQAFRFPSVSEI